MLRGNLSLRSEKTALDPDWPSSLLKAKFSTDETTTTPEQAYEKGMFEWDFASPVACDLVLREYKKLLDKDKKVFETWLKD